MNKAFVREPEFDGRAYCPQCGTLGTPVNEATLDRHVHRLSRPRMGDSAWFCDFARCDVAYFDLFERFVTVDELQSTVYPNRQFDEFRMLQITNQVSQTTNKK